MYIYTIRCGSLDAPEDWVNFGDSDAVRTFASIIYENEYQCIQLMLQYQDFKTLYDEIKPNKYANIHKRAFISFQIRFQSECIQEINKLREKAQLSPVKYPFVFIPSPSG